MIFDILNSEKIWHDNFTDLSTSPVRCSYFTLGNPKKSFSAVLFIHTSDYYNPLAHPTWKCHHTNFSIAKLFHLTEGLLRSFKRWKPRKEPVVGCCRWLWKEPFVMCGSWNVRQAMSASVQCDHVLYLYALPVFFDTDQSHSTPQCAEIYPMSQQAAATSLNMSVSIHALQL